ncbi:PrpF domain-containing protein, partial [Acinetobacter baumannii]
MSKIHELSQKRMDLEESKRVRMANGELGLDIYEMRPRLEEKGLIYVDRLEVLEVLLAVMGSPDVRQIDGIGGGDSLTSKIAIIGVSDSPEADIHYLFAQVNVDQAIVDYGQNCGNILAGVAPFALERGLIEAKDPITTVRVF